jgi:uncharacterized protein YjbJ (UPF0337 family)
MNKDQVKGKAKDVAGRIERQAGEWTGDPKKQVHGAAKQVEGKLQNAWGNAKEAAEDSVDDKNPGEKPVHDANEPEEDNIRPRRAS